MGSDQVIILKDIKDIGIIRQTSTFEPCGSLDRCVVTETVTLPL
jgi:hypothetical protein